ncbi:hypothetical protein CHS0354_021582 [Potamilus streckersoni]|uniref:Laccase n=1 Tax=Potamilus streckersoni TaxID=2493646 RepID=A0AAE0VZ35_9BIVA|nr:hypothetical protein CHS0354_021582 [Potamilus streckersoni]
MFTIAVFSLFLTGVDSTVRSDHLCNRPCIYGASPFTCEYYFTVEWYWVLSKACHECPFNLTDCFRPQCITANGYPRPVIAVNRTMPGPSIEVCEGDKVVVHVRNELEDGSSTSIHWHGQTQFNTCHMDGVGLLTQCNIPYKETFRYEFTAHPAGTHWYHSHTGMQIGDGLLGAFIVREPASRDPAGSLYNVDSSDHILVLQDFLDYLTITRYLNEMHNMWEVTIPIAGLVNGRGQKHIVLNTYGIINTTQNQSMTPREVFMVKANSSYRFRIISAAPRCPFLLSFDRHKMVVIATDGAPLKPATVDSLVIGSGERYDIVITTNQNSGNFWIQCQGIGDCEPNEGHASAILRYEGAPEADPPGNFTKWQHGTIFNPFPDPKVNRSLSQDIYQDSLRYGGTDEDYTSERVDVKYYIRTWFFHCHTDGHMQQGMAMVIKVGNLTQFPTPPSYFPRCGGYTYRDVLYKDTTSSTWRLHKNFSTNVLLTIVAILQLFLLENPFTRLFL